ncbi:ABC transporter permease [Reyranella soli]|uniref:Transport permease protein n=1 Tax=Reyranella soli TaxID=1230389 RepID=A0A512NI66_9HYPH|nr:ABC transporter permease [Reyranella soli]GEP58626.1 transport permease protein [Reyranella soli]
MNSSRTTMHSQTRKAWADAIRLQFRVIAALVRRETRAHFGESRLGYLWAIIEPMLHLIVLGLLFSYVLKRHSPLGGSMIMFMLTGLMTYFLFYKLAAYVAGAVAGNRSLLNLPPIKPLDVMISRAILEAATYLFVGFLMFLGLVLAGHGEAIPRHPLSLAAAIAVTIAFGFGVGTINAIIQVFVTNWSTIFGFLLSPLFLLSGLWFLPESVPPPFRGYLLYNPLMHCIMWVRSGYYRNYDPPDLDRGYAVLSSALTVAIGLMLLRATRRKLLEPT